MTTYIKTYTIRCSECGTTFVRRTSYVINPKHKMSCPSCFLVGNSNKEFEVIKYKRDILNNMNSSRLNNIKEMNSIW